MISEQLKAAIYRAVLQALIVGVLAAYADFQVHGNWREALAAGVGAGALMLLGRGGVEGTYDTFRQKVGAVLPGDVQAAPPPPMPKPPPAP